MASLLQFIFWAIGLLASLLSAAIFRGAAAVVVALVNLSKFPREACNDVLELARGLIGSVSQYALELIKDAAVSIVSSLFEALTTTVTGSVQLMASAMAELVEATRSALQELLEMLLQVLAGASEMVVKIAESVWSNYKDAVGYVMEKAL